MQEVHSNKPCRSLVEIQKSIGANWEALGDTERRRLVQYKALGEDLHDAKQAIPDQKTWIDWLTRYFQFSNKQATLYMQVASYWGVCRKCRSLREAIDLIRKHRAENKPKRDLPAGKSTTKESGLLLKLRFDVVDCLLGFAHEHLDNLTEEQREALEAISAAYTKAKEKAASKGKR